MERSTDNGDWRGLDDAAIEGVGAIKWSWDGHWGRQE